ncbi:repulsive guidance molecule A-like [Eriocheir sinensis]|uniref:repulsive guidance molecule A-like n=1 Tax=Eriocheir sinensis TaxID=95602 RepID=UPI0021C7C7E5|nr:repulsive guidance molecule A-like [Eriocheir sinensis]
MWPLNPLPAHCPAPPHPRLAATLLLTTLLIAGVGGECGFTACIDQYVAAGVEEGPTPAFCVLAASTSDCMAPLSSSCRSYIPYETQRRMLDNLMKRHDCATILATHHPPPAAPDGAPPPAADECQYRGTAAPAHCGLFGDPHLKTFGGAYMTCGVGGAWPLLNTPALAVQVTNEQVGPDNHATATTKVTVLVKEHGSCGGERTYEASAEALPRAFVDGTTWTGGSASRPHTQVQERVPGEHVLITVAYINATVAVRKIEKYLTVHVTLPESEVGEGEEMQLCVGGCPDNERLPTAPPPPVASPAMAKSQAVILCKEYNMTDYYLDSCIFDLMATGDKSFRVAALTAQRDLWEHDPVGAQRLLLNCSEPPCVWDVSAAHISASPSLALLLAALVLLGGARRAGR